MEIIYRQAAYAQCRNILRKHLKVLLLVMRAMATVSVVFICTPKSMKSELKDLNALT